MALNQNENKYSGKVNVTKITISSEQKSFPTHRKSNFKTLEDWLFDICKNDKPEKQIEEYKFNYYWDESGNYTLFLQGVNSYEERGNDYITTNERIEFTPSNMYFKLPKGEYKNLDKKETEEKITSQLKDFLNTEVFKASFFVNANTITTTYNGETIWSK